MYLKYRNTLRALKYRLYCVTNKPLYFCTSKHGQLFKNYQQSQNTSHASGDKTRFSRTWDATCPKVWDFWVEHGKRWVIQDLPPEHDEEALKLFVEHFCPDEVLCRCNNIVSDPESMRSITDVWRKYLGKRTSLACYVEDGGKRKLAAVNVCMVTHAGEDPNDEIHGVSWKNIYNALTFLESKEDKFKHLGLDRILYALGIVVAREFRWMNLGARVLMAREPLSLSFGIKGTAAIFTGPASQKIAARAGFTTIATTNMREMADARLMYPKAETRVIKLMVKKYQ